MFKKLLIANRGEIAARIIKSARELGIKTIAVYSEADKWSHYVSMADEAHLIGPPAPKESYLNIKKIIQVARQTRTDCIHPGYGFISENPNLALACRVNKITFIGPSPEAMKRLGNKLNSKKIAEKAGIKVIPGLDKNVTAKEVRSFGKKYGFPLLLKAIAGGGGRGMRIIRSERESPHLIDEARKEAQTARGDSRLFLEKYFDQARHIEVQILADNHGNVVDLYERECSVQRRHQKLIEESPSPAINPDQRKRLTQDARKIIEAGGYTNAATVEFLLDKHGNHYFMEVNTRLQVEHPVTEMVTGIDIVKEQFKIANGHKLDIKRNKNGHAIECRILAEDPYNNFTPSVGKILAVAVPTGPHIRIDTDILPGYYVTSHYDSLIAKLIVWGQDRETAIKRMKNGLLSFKLAGVNTTIPFHKAVMSSKEFNTGKYNTTFVERVFRMPEVKKEVIKDAVMIAAAIEFNHREKRLANQPSPQTLSQWKLAIQETN